MAEAALSSDPLNPELPLFADFEAPQNSEAGSVPVLVQRGQSFEGLMSFRGTVRVEGTFQGHLAGSGRIEIARHAHITGVIEADEVVVEGRVEGEIVARATLEILATAEVRGILTTPRLDAHEGCEVRAHCRTDRSYELPPSASNQEPDPKNGSDEAPDA